MDRIPHTDHIIAQATIRKFWHENEKSDEFDISGPIDNLWELVRVMSKRATTQTRDRMIIAITAGLLYLDLIFQFDLRISGVQIKVAYGLRRRLTNMSLQFMLREYSTLEFHVICVCEPRRPVIV